MRPAVPGEPGASFVLHDAAVQPSTLVSYARAARAFFAFVRLHNGRPVTSTEWDSWLVCYFEHLWSGGNGRSVGDRTLCGFMHFCPDVGGNLPMARRSLAGWGRLRPSESHKPMSWTVVCGVAMHACVEGNFESALAFLLAHDCFLRRSEVAGIRVRDVVDDGVSGRLLLVLPRTKTGMNQSVAVRHPVVAAWLRAAVASASGPSAYLFPSGRCLYDHFSSACVSLGVGAVGFVFHSLRHGGATDAYLRMGEGSVASVQVRGRWRQTATLQRYLQQAPAVIAQLSIPQHVRDLCDVLSTDMHRRFSPFFPGRT